MSAPTPPASPTTSGAEPASISPTSSSATARQAWQRFRGPLLIIGIIVVAGLVYGILTSRSTGGPMDPQSAQRPGARALSVLLEQRGVDVQRVDRIDAALDNAGSDATLLVTVPDRLTGPQLKRLGDAGYARIVLFEPSEGTLGAITTKKVFAAGDALAKVRDPGCELPAAKRAGPVDVRGPMYRAPVSVGTGPGNGTGSGVEVCYGDGTRGAVVEVAGEPTLDLVGSPRSFSNAELANEGNAALALNLLGHDSRLVWYLPSLQDVPRQGDPDSPEGRQVSMWSLLPANVRFAAGAVAVGGIFLMIAAARRLGPVVPEPLPVVVRASEAAEGRARLYRRFRARDRAAAALRQSTRTRLQSVLGLPFNAGDPALFSAVSARTGRTAEEVAGLLGEHPPEDDGGLVRLAADLDTLEQEVRRS
ncbi:DUF4350 domain-containing protein [Flindersiella endophytica]